MSRTRKLNLFLLLLCVTGALGSGGSTLQRDVVVVGGGSSGTYTAIRLQQEGLSVALLERNNRLGGHVNTFQVPNTTATFDYGVILFHNITVATNYFSTLGVETITAPSGGDSVVTYANLNGDAKGQTVAPPGVLWANSTAAGEALTRYINLYNTQFPFLDDGFNLPDPVPEDILLSWADFMAKYDLDAASFSAYQVVQGVGDEMALPAIYVMKYFSGLTAGGFLGIGPPLITTADFNNQGIYDKALDKLGQGEGAFLNATITRITRNNDGVAVVMHTPDGKATTVNAKQLVLAIPPVVADLRAIGLDLSPEEENLFGQASFRYYFDSVIQNTGIPDNVSITNIDFAEPDGIPTSDRMVLGVGESGVPGLKVLYYSSTSAISDADAQTDILATLARYRAANGLNASVEPVFVGFNNHEPYEVTVPVDAIRNGYYKKRNALQGCQNTWYTGAAWQAHDSAMIWNFTETVVVEKVVKVLCRGGKCK
ncbi:Flavin-containing superfamily amine oxidase [Mycena sanguinolenta]|uniref:Flavin-containing superfamily amine oxidase n=1 Tax=Mycena sanguinolenta TaxID=230812 RepID=A0A8H7DJS1_9AGAR|nr:Flavin-containing superfamily amine oxidase [Mycena sanguinolenta]